MLRCPLDTFTVNGVIHFGIRRKTGFRLQFSSRIADHDVLHGLPQLRPALLHALLKLLLRVLLLLLSVLFLLGNELPRLERVRLVL